VYIVYPKLLTPQQPYVKYLNDKYHRPLSQSIKTLQTQAEGLCQVLSTKPGHATLEVHRDVFGHAHDDGGGQSEVAVPSSSNASSVRQPIKRAVEETTARTCFVPPMKKTTRE